eukprot:scaffold5759_cov26-Tisochrysis_lutea.AAC.2
MHAYALAAASAHHRACVCSRHRLCPGAHGGTAPPPFKASLLLHRPHLAYQGTSMTTTSSSSCVSRSEHESNPALGASSPKSCACQVGSMRVSLSCMHDSHSVRRDEGQKEVVSIPWTHSRDTVFGCTCHALGKKASSQIPYVWASLIVSGHFSLAKLRLFVKHKVASMHS